MYHNSLSIHNRCVGIKLSVLLHTREALNTSGLPESLAVLCYRFRANDINYPDIISAVFHLIYNVKLVKDAGRRGLQRMV